MNLKLYNTIRDACDDFNKQFKQGDFLRIITKSNPLTVLHVFLLSKAVVSDNKIRITAAPLFDKENETNSLMKELNYNQLSISGYKIERCEFDQFIDDFNSITRCKVEEKKEKIKQLKNEIYDMSMNSKRVKTDFNSLKNDVDEYIKIRKR